MIISAEAFWGIIISLNNLDAALRQSAISSIIDGDLIWWSVIFCVARVFDVSGTAFSCVVLVEGFDVFMMIELEFVGVLSRTISDIVDIES